MNEKLSVIRGEVSGLKEEEAVNYMARFRIDNRPVVCYMKANIVNGDILKAVIREGGEADIVAFRNESTKLVYGPPEPEPKLSIGMIIFGILTIPCIGVGFLIIWMAWDSYRGQFKLRDYARKVKAMLN
jgi:hypothetical protein